MLIIHLQEYIIYIYVQYIRVHASEWNTNTNATEVSNFTLLASIEQINIFMRMCRMFVQLKASGENSVCVAADEPIHPFCGFVCFDLALLVQVNIIVKLGRQSLKNVPGC